MKIYRVRHTLFDTIEGFELKAKETVKELFFSAREDAEKSMSLYLEKSKGKGHSYTDEPVNVEGLVGHYDASLEAMVSVDELDVYTRES